jgi:predicted RecB family nuclease
LKITAGRLRLAASDVANFLACQQLTQLDLQAARKQRRPAREFDIGFQDLVRRGEEHELAVLAQFRAQGHEVADLSEAADPAEATKAAIRAGAGVIYQATLTSGDEQPLLGRPDFLVRADVLQARDGHGRPAASHYEVVDAKLARTAKARAVLQTAFYSRLLAELQGTEPTRPAEYRAVRKMTLRA